MNPEADYCPGCGAQVYPEETHCPFCGHKLRAGPLTPVLLGAVGAVVAVICGGLVWWVLSSPAVPGLGAAPAPATASQQQSAAPATGDTAAGQGMTPAVVKTDTDRVPSAPPSAAARNAALPSDGRMPHTVGADPSTAPPAAAGAAPARDEPATVASLPRDDGAPPPDAETRKLFAQSTQQKFTQNGLDLSVSTSGPEGTTLNIKFNFPAKTAAELIVAGPFPRQCEQRGFRQVVFLDPSGAAWVYDVASAQLTQR